MMFSGVKALFMAGAGFAPGEVDLHRTNLQRAGGEILDPIPESLPEKKIAPIFARAKKKRRRSIGDVLPPDTTHVIVGRKVSPETVASDLHVAVGDLKAESQRRGFALVSVDWLIKSLVSKERLVEDSFSINLMRESHVFAANELPGAGAAAVSAEGGVGVTSSPRTARCADQRPSLPPLNAAPAPPALIQLKHAPIVQDEELSVDDAGIWHGLQGSGLMRFIPKKRRYSTHIAAFDLDGTIITTRSGKTFAKDATDWKLWQPSILQKLREVWDAGYRVSLISNQLGVAKQSVSKADLRKKLDTIVSQLSLPVEVILCCAEDEYRKPLTGAWNLLVSDNGNLRPVLEECFYVGDAAGRPKDGAFKKDFGCSDLKFALNVGIPFATPEQFFLGSRARIHCDRSLALLGFDPKTLPLTGFPPSVLEARTVDDKELVLFVGSPAAGKSWTAQRYFPDHVRICQDELGTKNACERAARDALRCGKNVVIDSTNPSVQKRSSWVRLATEEDARPHCILLSRDKGLCFHMNAFRKFNLASSEKRLVPNVAIHTFYKHYEQPTVNEGFASVLSVPFVPTFSTEDERRLFFSFLLK